MPFAGAAATGAKLIGKGLQKYGDEAAGLVSNCMRTNSFVAGTPVLLADGSTKPIEDVQLGDEVQATDPTTGETGPRAVTDLIVGTGEKELVQVTFDTDGTAGDKIDVVTATGGHPFWVSDKGVWRDAKDLASGDDVRTAEGLSLEVVGTTARTEYLTVYNLTVDGLHTYYVLAGTAPILVHNTNCDPVVLYRSPGTGNRASEANGLNTANHAGDHPTAYLSNLPEGAAHYAGNGHELGMHVFTMKPGFREAFGNLEFPLENSMGLTEGLTEWRIPASRFDEFNSYIDHGLTEWWDAADGHFFPPPGSTHSP